MEKTISKLILGLASLLNPRFKILAYHGVVKANPSLYEVNVKDFREQINTLRDYGYQVINLLSAVEMQKERRINGRVIVITFDDAHESVLENAIPILEEYHYTATLFIPTGLAGQLDNFSGGLGNKRIMNWSQLEMLHTRGFSMGSHTVHHYNMITLDPDSLQYEIDSSYEALVENFGLQKYFIAYPYGLLNEKVRDSVVASPFVGAVCYGSVLSNWEKTDAFLLKREKVLSTTTQAEFIKIINPDYDLSRAWRAIASKFF